WPQCQQVVTAPPRPLAATVVVPITTPPAAWYDLSFSIKKEQDEHESIFAEGGGEDIFGQPPQPRLELPPEPAPPNPELQPTNFPAPSVVVPAVPSLEMMDPTVFQQADVSPPVHLLETTEFLPEMAPPGTALADGNPFGPSLGEPAADAAVDGTSDLPSGPISATPSATQSQPRAGGPKLLYWLVIFLFPYSLVISAVAIWHYFHW